MKPRQTKVENIGFFSWHLAKASDPCQSVFLLCPLLLPLWNFSLLCLTPWTWKWPFLLGLLPPRPLQAWPHYSAQSQETEDMLSAKPAALAGRWGRSCSGPMPDKPQGVPGSWEVLTPAQELPLLPAPTGVLCGCSASAPSPLHG